MHGNMYRTGSGLMHCVPLGGGGGVGGGAATLAYLIGGSQQTFVHIELYEMSLFKRTGSSSFSIF